MAIYEHLSEFMGFRVVDWEPGDPIADPKGTAYRLSVSWDEAEKGKEWSAKLDAFLAKMRFISKPEDPDCKELSAKLAAFLAEPSSREVAGLVVGPWGEVASGESDASVVVNALVAARDQLPRLSALFLGDIISEESEISWITQSDVSPLFAAFPGLEHFAVRGGNKLTFGSIRHARLKTLIVQAGGLPKTVVSEILTGHLPELRHLELWLGEENYGGDASITDLKPLLSGEQFLKLEYLGLCDSMFSDEIAAAIVTSPLLKRLRVLDLSLGTLSDIGAEILLGCPEINGLEKLDLHHHYCSNEMMERLKRMPIEVDVSERVEIDDDDDDDERYVAVSE